MFIYTIIIAVERCKTIAKWEMGNGKWEMGNGKWDYER